MIPPGKHGEHMAELVRLRRQVAAVRALHTSDDSGVCAWCEYTWPCSTIRALDAPATTDEEVPDGA